MSFTPRAAGRMQAVQTPVISIVGDIVRATPGAISLGQGVVHYGPPSRRWRRHDSLAPNRTIINTKQLKELRSSPSLLPKK